MDPEKLRNARDKLTRVFQYLQALDQHRNPPRRKIHEQPWTLRLLDLPEHASIKRGGGRVRSTKATAASGQTADSANTSFVLKAQRPKLTLPPVPPPEIADWLKSGWDDPSNEVLLVDPQGDSGQPDDSDARRPEGNPSKFAALQRWKTLRDEWAKDEKPARSAMKIFEMLYALYGRINREAERVELILGDGILAWRRPEGSINHPILLQRLQLSFDASVPEFTLAEADHPVELYSALFQSMPDVDGRAIGRCREELEKEGFHPLFNGSTSEFLKRLVVQLSPRGEFVENGPPGREENNPCIGRDPILFLRARTLGYAAAIEGILADLRARDDLPWSLLNIVGDESPIPESAEEDQSAGINEKLAADVLLSKPANPEQIRIARQLERHGGVLVQGPPGTGKTHTIGNLIGHLLAHGKSVLVTSHTTKALRMVRHHIVPELRPLCVSVLESDLDSRKQLESAVGSIAEKLSRADAGSLQSEAKLLEAQRLDLLKKCEQFRNQLTEARADEYRDVVMGGKTWTPSDAARKVAQEKDAHGWIPGPVAAVAPLPLAPAELADLYRTNISVSREDESELSAQLPELHDLPGPGEFEEALDGQKRLNAENLDLRADLWESGTAECSPDELQGLSVNLARAVSPLSGTDKWKLAAVYAGKYGDVHREPWDRLISFVRRVHREAASSRESFLKYGPELPSHLALEDQERIAGEILAHLEGGGKLGSLALFTRKAWVHFIEQSKINHERPRLPEHFHALRQLSRLKILRKDLAARWDRQMAELGAPRASEMGEEIEKTLMQFCDALEDCLNWHERTWLPLQQQLQDLGLNWDGFLAEQPAVVGAEGELVRIGQTVSGSLPPILESRYKKLKLLQLNRELQELESKLRLASRLAKSSKTTAQILKAVRDKDAAHYREAYERLLELKSRQADLELRRSLLARLETAAPTWAAAVRNRTGVHGRGEPPSDPMAAWTWRQLNDELDRRASTSLQALVGKIEKLQEELQRVTIELIDKRAWSAQASRTSPPQRQALVGWLDTIRRIGKGHGTRVALLRAEAARKMTQCRGAVPAWVMPLSRVVENFDPRVTRFDVVIIDEASQSDIMALIALYLGKTVLVVGDHEQVSPSAVGQDLSIIQNLIFQYLSGIPNSDLYDGQISVYDLARQSFGGATCLVEHFRCVPDIIQFSNVISYDGRIKPLRDSSRVHLRPHTIAQRVSGSSRDGKINRQEALTVASLIAAAIEHPAYETNDAGQPVSFGVVSLVGDEQALEIDYLLRKHISPERYEHHRLLCGNAAQFQGDERDVVFISLVDTAERGPLSMRDQEIFKQRFNVAASRARDQMWVVHSLDPHHDLKADDLRRQLIEHAHDPNLFLRALEQKEIRPQSAFEREVMKRLTASGYRVAPQWRVGAFRIDLVVEGESRRLAIECDGDRYQPLEKLPEDLDRQGVLERMGWSFARIRGSEFFRNPERALKPVIEKLQLLEIFPVKSKANAGGKLLTSALLIDSVIRRAEELRNDWSGREATSSKRQGSPKSMEKTAIP